MKINFTTDLGKGTQEETTMLLKMIKEGKMWLVGRSFDEAKEIIEIFYAAGYQHHDNSHGKSQIWFMKDQQEASDQGRVTLYRLWKSTYKDGSQPLLGKVIDCGNTNLRDIESTLLLVMGQFLIDNKTEFLNLKDEN